MTFCDADKEAKRPLRRIDSRESAMAWGGYAGLRGRQTGASRGEPTDPACVGCGSRDGLCGSACERGNQTPVCVCGLFLQGFVWSWLRRLAFRPIRTLSVGYQSVHVDQPAAQVTGHRHVSRGLNQSVELVHPLPWGLNILIVDANRLRREPGCRERPQWRSACRSPRWSREWSSSHLVRLIMLPDFMRQSHAFVGFELESK